MYPFYPPKKTLRTPGGAASRAAHRPGEEGELKGRRVRAGSQVFVYLYLCICICVFVFVYLSLHLGIWVSAVGPLYQISSTHHSLTDMKYATYSVGNKTETNAS